MPTTPAATGPTLADARRQHADAQAAFNALLRDADFGTLDTAAMRREYLANRGRKSWAFVMAMARLKARARGLPPPR